MKPTNLVKIKEREKVYNTVSELYNKRFENYYDKYNELSDVKKDKLDQKFKPLNFKRKYYGYHGWFKEEEIDEKEELDDLPPLRGNEEVKERKGLKILTPNKLLIRLPILLAQIKAGNNSYKFKKKSDQYHIFFIKLIKQKRFTTI